MAVDTYGSAALQSLNRILQYQQSRDRSQVQEALQLMQFSQQKRQFDMQSAAKNLELLDNANKQFKLKTAQKFAEDLGMSNVYMKFKDNKEKAMTDAVDYLTDTWSPLSKTLFEDMDEGLDETVASELVSATWQLYGDAKNPDSLINIGSKLSPDKEPTAENKALLKAFSQLGYYNIAEGADNTNVIKTFQAMNDALVNESNIMEETQEYVKGDYDIQRDFEFTERAIKALEQEAGVDEPVPAGTQVVSNFAPSEQLNQSFDLIQSKRKEISDNEASLKQLAENLENTKLLKAQGLEVPEEWELQYQNYANTEHAINEKIRLLSEDIEKLTMTNRNLKRAMVSKEVKEGKHGPSGLGKIPEGIVGGLDAYQKASIWSDTGVWVTDEELEEWEKARGTMTWAEFAYDPWGTTQVPLTPEPEIYSE